MNMNDAVAERRAVLASCNIDKYLAYRKEPFPKSKSALTQAYKRMYREIAACPYLPPELRAAARAWLGKHNTSC